MQPRSESLIQVSDETPSTHDISPRVGTRISNEPVGVVGPVGAVGGRIEVH